VVALGVVDDILNANRSSTNPDAGAWEYFNTPCTGVPAMASAIAPTTMICPNNPVTMYLSPTNTLMGITYQWQSSTLSPVGPWGTVSIGTSTNAALTTTVGTIPLYYSAVITCTNGNNSVISVASTVNVAPSTTNTIPYFEGFEGISVPGELPNCSWTANNRNITCFTYTNVMTTNRSARTGQKYGAFYYTPANNNQFWTNQIWMDAGVTYSINVYYKTEHTTAPTYQLNLWLNQGQTTTGGVVIATTGGPGSAADPSYKLLNNTFSVTASGFYNVGINAVSNAVCCGNYMSWDDLEITIPCQLNAPQMSITSSTQNICAGQSVNLFATGADTYIWSEGSSTESIVATPSVSTNYVVVGSHAASGCTTSLSQFISVLPTPVLGVFAPATSVCKGSSLLLTAYGALTYTWSPPITLGSVFAVSPTVNTTYSVMGSNSFGCNGSTSQLITVNALPTGTITSSSASDIVCREDYTELNAIGSGAVSFQWLSSSGVMIGNPVLVNPQLTTTYSLVVTSAQGCTANAMPYELNVQTCVGLNEHAASAMGVKVYPNPTSGEISIELNNGLVKKATVADVTGRVVRTATTELGTMNIDLSSLDKGVYLVRIESNGAAETISVVKE
jgi:hypothetical protein